MKAGLNPLADRIIVKRLPFAEVRTDAGVIESVERHQSLCQGEVMAVGPGRWQNTTLMPMTVKLGDTVLFEKIAGQAFVLKGEEMVLLYEAELIGILK